ncbi:MAG: 50S ribosomal protein L25, partial [Candidatus Obscuribacterales bacterium]|nr:50S ribosomal protein L25 [Candidatus Obscuribacterales bacterium]
KLNVKTREEKTPKALRREGQIPATLYGPTFQSESVQLNAHEFSRLSVAAYSHLIDLDFGKDKPVSVIIRNVQRKSTTDQPLHVEFYRVRLDKLLTVTVPIKFVGTSPAVTAGAQFFEVSQTVDIECLPGNIPDSLEADISELKDFDSVLKFSDLKVADDIRILNPEDEIVAKAASPRTASEEETTSEAGESVVAAAGALASEPGTISES